MSSCRPIRAVLLGLACLVCQPSRSLATDCPRGDDHIETDRPDVTNSSLVVPQGSVQIENGVNWVTRRTGQNRDAPETRIRFGAFHCAEILVDVPNYTRSLDGRSSAGLSQPIVSIKRQLFAGSPSFSLSATAGVGVPGPAMGALVQGFSPYVQFPWSRPITDDWSVNGMVTLTWPAIASAVLEPTLVLERDLGRKGDMFVEYIGDYTSGASASHVLDGGGGLRITPTHQIDFHVGVGLTRRAPRTYVGVGYSLRVDNLVKRGKKPQSS